MANSAQREPVSATAALTGGLAARDEEAFRQFHAAYFDRLLRYHLVIMRGDEHAAHEALQETFLRVVRPPRRCDDEEIFWSWLTVLARSAATDASAISTGNCWPTTRARSSGRQTFPLRPTTPKRAGTIC